jgi:hypothetical protein
MRDAHITYYTRYSSEAEDEGAPGIIFLCKTLNGYTKRGEFTYLGLNEAFFR